MFVELKSIHLFLQNSSYFFKILPNYLVLCKSNIKDYLTIFQPVILTLYIYNMIFF